MQQPLIGGVMTLRPKPLTAASQGFTLMSDLHQGCSQVDDSLVRQELDCALAHGDRILFNGDLFDLILPQDHKRFQPHVLHPYLLGSPDIINKVVDMAFELLKSYAHLIDMIGVGNHDEITKYTSIDPVLLLVNRLNTFLKGKSLDHTILYGGYSGFLCYQFPRGKAFSIYYHHGFGGGAALSGAAGDLNKMLAQVEGVDLIWLGHKHWKLASHVQRISPATKGCHPNVRQVRFVRTGAYLQPLAGQTQEDIRRNGRRAHYSTDKGYTSAGLGGARLLVDSSKNPLAVKVIQ